jgi:hypothetical protein
MGPSKHTATSAEVNEGLNFQGPVGQKKPRGEKNPEQIPICKDESISTSHGSFKIRQ